MKWGVKGGCDFLQWELRVILEGDLGTSTWCIDVVNGLNEMELDAMRASLDAHEPLHKLLLLLFDILYKIRVEELWL